MHGTSLPEGGGGNVHVFAGDHFAEDFGDADDGRFDEFFAFSRELRAAEGLVMSS